MLRIDLQPSQIQQLASQIRSFLPHHILLRGYQYYRNQQVNLVDVVDGEVAASVAGSRSRPYTVHLSLTAVQVDSDCDCPYGGGCKHIAAAFFAVYAQYEPAEGLFQRGTAMSSVETAPAVRTSADSSSQTKRLPIQELPSETDEETWLPYLLAAFAPVTPNVNERRMRHERHYVLQQCLNQVLGISAYWARDVRARYQLLAFLLALKAYIRSANLVESLQQRYSLANEWRNELANHLRSLRMITRDYGGGSSREEIVPDANLTPASARAMATTLREFLLDEPWAATVTDIAGTFQTIWLTVLSPYQQLQRSELDKLWQAMKTGLHPEMRDEAVRLALMTLHVLLGENEEARASLLRADGSIIPSAPFLVLNILSMATGPEKPETVRGWLRFITPLSQQQPRDVQEQIGNWWIHVGQQSDDLIAESLHGLKLLCPGASHVYESALEVFECHRERMELLLKREASPLDYRVDFAKGWEAIDADYVLPFYHQAVQCAVEVKTRDGYKKAVRILKRLAAVYKRRKQQAEWQNFMVRFASKYSRFRALQEELRKGKLIP